MAAKQSCHLFWCLAVATRHLRFEPGVNLNVINHDRTPDKGGIIPCLHTHTLVTALPSWPDSVVRVVRKNNSETAKPDPDADLG